MTDVMVLVTVVDEEHPRFGESGTVDERTLHRTAKAGVAGRLPCRFADGVEILGFSQVEILPSTPGEAKPARTRQPRRG